MDPSRLRPAGLATRSAIEAAARELFAERGYDGASVRAIAAEAGVDPALVIRHFGSKEALFLRTIDTSLGVGAVVEGPIETVGRRLVAYFLDADRPAIHQRYVALSEAAHHAQVRDEMVRYNAEVYVAKMTPRMTGEDRELRVSMAMAQLGGLLHALFRLREPRIVDADPAALVAQFGDSIQRMITPEAFR